MKCRIVKVGRGTSTPSKYRHCKICGKNITDFRFEVVTNEGPNESYDITCMAEFYFNIKTKWWYKLFAYFRLAKMKIFIEIPDVTEKEADGSNGSNNID